MGDKIRRRIIKPKMKNFRRFWLLCFLMLVRYDSFGNSSLVESENELLYDCFEFSSLISIT